MVAFAILLVALLIADAAVYGAIVALDSQESDASLAAEAGTMIAGLSRSDGQFAFGRVSPSTETSSGVAVHAILVRPDGSLAGSSGPFVLPQSTIQSIANAVRGTHRSVWATDPGLNGVVRRVYAQPLVSAAGTTVLMVSRSLKELQTLQALTLLALAALSLAVVLFGTGLTYWQAGRILRPVRSIAETARSLSEHDLHRRVDVHVPPDELGELVETFNGMLARLDAAFESLSRFTADASHELRAPLAVMRTEIEVALANPDAGDRDNIMRTLQAEVEHLTRVAEQLLILARADAGALQPAREAVDVADFLHLVAARWSTPAERRAVRLMVEAPDSGIMTTDPALTRRVLDNLVENAVRHTRRGGRVWLRSEHRDASWTFEVADEGPGVPEHLRGRLFARFARADSARRRNGSGAGLGLALSAAIARAYGGDLRLISGVGQGATFRFTIPD